MLRSHASDSRAARAFRVAVLGLIAAALPGAVPPLVAQDLALPAAPDSAALVQEARELQRDFERYRESRLPLTPARSSGGCDERIGRWCIWFGGASDEVPPEPIEIGLARRELIGALYETFDLIRDPWVIGQLVLYLSEEGSLREAEGVARGCELSDAWWCSALLGYVLHLQGNTLAAEAAFAEAVSVLPPAEEGRWRTPRFLLSDAGRRAFEAEDPAGRDRLWKLLWELSDPLFLVEGNDRRTEHYARLVEVRIREEAVQPHGATWEADLEEVLVRYGRNTGYSRQRPAGGVPLGGPSVQDRRTTVAHHDPASRGYLFPEAFLTAPAEVPPESWITAPREARDWHTPRYAPDFRALETQVARFRRDTEILVVGAYRPAPPARDPFAAIAPPSQQDRFDPFAPRAEREAAAAASPATGSGSLNLGPVRAGLFLLPEEGGELISVLGAEPEGVLLVHAPPGRYVTSLELLEPGAGRAWRARQGVVQNPMVRGLVAVSDLLILREDAPLPADFEEAVPLARPGIRVRQGERFGVAWEVYGLQVEEEVRVTLGFTEGRPGFLARVGEFLGILQPDRPVEISFTDSGPDEVQTLFRSVQLTLPALAPGEYTLHLRLEIPGREPALASRPIIVEP